jgi:hypothetical protein
VAKVMASRPRVLNSVGVVVAVRGVARRWQGWPYGADGDGDGAAAGLASLFDPALVTRKGFEGAAGGSHAWLNGHRSDVLSPYVPTTPGCRHSARRGAAVAGMAAQG